MAVTPVSQTGSPWPRSSPMSASATTLAPTT
nr:MAG TPA: hypothetical protein [Caudoviricetes sp.]